MNLLPDGNFLFIMVWWSSIQSLLIRLKNGQVHYSCLSWSQQIQTWTECIQIRNLWHLILCNFLKNKKKSWGAVQWNTVSKGSIYHLKKKNSDKKKMLKPIFSLYHTKTKKFASWRYWNLSQCSTGKDTNPSKTRHSLLLPWNKNNLKCNPIL